MSAFLSRLGCIVLCLACPLTLAQEGWLDRLDEALAVESSDGEFRADLSGLMDLETYYIDQRGPAVLVTDDPVFVNPRLSLFLDTRLGPHFYSFVQARLDSGFDPGYHDHTWGDFLNARADEYLVRYTPFDDSRVNLQFGKFATVVGNWVPRHDSWSNPFINAPLPYENILIITDQIAPASQGAFLARRNVPDRKNLWLPILWGPVYASGGSVFGQLDRFDYAVEVKNASLSSRPIHWNIHDTLVETPNLGARVGYRPEEAWNIGTSFGYGSYLQPTARGSLPAGKDVDDYNQVTFGQDLGFAWRHWQIWAEFFAARFEVPSVGNADTLAYYLESKYKLTPDIFWAARWNQQFFSEVPDGTGGSQRWDRDMWRIETAIGWRITRHTQAKLQYSYSHQNGSFQQGEQLVAAQATVKF